MTNSVFSSKDESELWCVFKGFPRNNPGLHSGEDPTLGAHNELSFYRVGILDDKFQEEGKCVPVKPDSEPCIPFQTLSGGTVRVPHPSKGFRVLLR